MRNLAASITIMALFAAGPAFAWGEAGHEVVGVIAYDRLTPGAKARVDARLASDPDPLTAPDFASRTVWADKYRTTHNETYAWHFADIEIATGDLSAACFGFPPLKPGQLASQGPAQDCVVNKIEEFAKELKDPATPHAEQLLALKFLLHFVADLHQPLHSSDHEDKGGNCVNLEPPRPYPWNNLHSFWDTEVVAQLGDSPVDIAIRLERDITPAKAAAWARGGPRDWAMDTFAVAKTDVYKLPSRPTCGEHGSVALSQAYQAQARQDAVIQLEKAGVRLAYVLNHALGS